MVMVMVMTMVMVVCVALARLCSLKEFTHEYPPWCAIGAGDLQIVMGAKVVTWIWKRPIATGARVMMWAITDGRFPIDEQTACAVGGGVALNDLCASGELMTCELKGFKRFIGCDWSHGRKVLLRPGRFRRVCACL